MNHNVPFPGSGGAQPKQIRIDVAGMVQGPFNAQLLTLLFRQAFPTSEARLEAMTGIAHSTAMAVAGQIKQMRDDPGFSHARIDGTLDRVENMAGQLLGQIANGVAGCEVIGTKRPEDPDNGKPKGRIITDV